jgi:7,8-dihydroneopterin aldolase/epimerase/oxygenase
MIDHIHIEQLKIQARVGVPDSERAQAQRLTLNITFWPKRSGMRDNIADTVNYSEVAASLKQFVSQRDYRLIETLAEETAGHLLARFPLRKVAVEVRKFVLADADHVSVTAIREQ